MEASLLAQLSTKALTLSQSLHIILLWCLAFEKQLSIPQVQENHIHEFKQLNREVHASHEY